MFFFFESEEIWKDIPNYEGIYQASTQGRIRSIDRVVEQKGRNGTLHSKTLKGRILKPGRYCKSGHVSVVLGKGMNGKPVHQLVMFTFVGPRPDGLDIRHLNGIPTDNRLENLTYGTRTDNILDVIRLGKSWRKLSRNQANEIKVRLSQGERGSDLAKEFGVSQTNISDIKYGRIHTCAL